MEANPVNNNKSDDIRAPTICLFVEHGCPEMSHSLYMIQPPVVLSDDLDSEGFMSDSQYIRPILTFPDHNSFLPTSASVTLGSKLYFFGGKDYALQSRSYPHHLYHQVLVFDTDRPHLGMQTLSPLNAPKFSPCVFVADGFIYALGSSFSKSLLPASSKGSGSFERYDPCSNHWEVLPDPPPPFLQWKHADYLDDATLVGRLVFISSYLHVVFNLDTQAWEPRLPPDLAARFPFGSLFVPDSASLYRLRGPFSWKPGTVYHPPDECLQVVKTGPLTITGEGDYVGSLLNSPCLVSGEERVMAEGIDLDDNFYFTEHFYCPWMDLFHMGGRFFCYVATAQLVNPCDFSHNEPQSRGVLIKFFEEVKAHHADNCNNAEDNNETQFRPLASFCYKINTDFRNPSFFIRCSVLGSVPDSWIKAPMKKKTESMKAEPRLYEAAKQGFDLDNTFLLGNSQVENTENTETGGSDPITLLSLREEEISKLRAELAAKNKLLKAYEARLMESVDVNG